MKLRYLLPLGLAVLSLAGCSTSQPANPQGATYDDYQMGNSTAESSPQPAGSPTFRPGMNPQDPRDPHFTTRPQPFQQPPATK